MVDLLIAGSVFSAGGVLGFITGAVICGSKLSELQDENVRLMRDLDQDYDAYDALEFEAKGMARKIEQVKLIAGDGKRIRSSRILEVLGK